MKCSIMPHFIWIFTVSHSTRLGVSLKQTVDINFADINVLKQKKMKDLLDILFLLGDCFVSIHGRF